VVSVLSDSSGWVAELDEPEAAMEGEAASGMLVDSLLSGAAVDSLFATEFEGALSTGAFARLSERAGGSFLFTKGVASPVPDPRTGAEVLVPTVGEDWRSESLMRPELRSIAVVLLPLALPSSSLLLTDLREEFVLDSSGDGAGVVACFFESTTPLAALSAGRDKEGAFVGGVGMLVFEEPLGVVLLADELLDGMLLGKAGFCVLTGRLPFRGAAVLGDLLTGDLPIGELVVGADEVLGAEPVRLRVPVAGGSTTGAAFWLRHREVPGTLGVGIASSGNEGTSSRLPEGMEGNDKSALELPFFWLSTSSAEVPRY
jgi:hypothetical protein